MSDSIVFYIYIYIYIYKATYIRKYTFDARRPAAVVQWQGSMRPARHICPPVNCVYVWGGTTTLPAPPGGNDRAGGRPQG
jgi:hypothetical protein